jgi:di/tricarboxylate transporter
MRQSCFRTESLSKSDVECAVTSAPTDGTESGKKTHLRHMIFLSVAYAANTGGTGTLTGTGSNLAFKGQLSNMNPDIPVNFANWMIYAIPGMLVNVFICWLWLQLWFIDYGRSPISVMRTWCSWGGGENENVKAGY